MCMPTKRNSSGTHPKDHAVSALYVVSPLLTTYLDHRDGGKVFLQEHLRFQPDPT